MSLARLSLSVVIPNYNYERYVGAAIESALAVEWPEVEVIVVDDGSTDGSRKVIASYGERVRAIFQDNAGHLAACNRGFAASRGAVVLFLDSDDLLAPSVMRETARAWSPRTSKVQFQMRLIDGGGRPLGSSFPQFDTVPAPEQVRAWAMSTASYPTPPCSGNAYSRTFLERIFPLPESCRHTVPEGSRCPVCSFSDSFCVAAAPLLGEVRTVRAPLVSYRVHGQNDGAVSGQDVRAFGREVTRGLLRDDFARRIAAQEGLVVPEGAINRSLHYLSYRMASLRLAPAGHPLPGDRLARVLADFSAALFAPQGLAVRSKLAYVAWAAGVGLLPLALARKLVAWRFAPAARPAALKSVLATLRVVRA